MGYNIQGSEVYDTLAKFPATGTFDVTYKDKSNDNEYKWDGGTYVLSVVGSGDLTTALNLKEDKSNKSSSYTASSTTTYANTKALVDGLATKEPTIAGTTSADFWSGAKTFINFATTARNTILTGLTLAYTRITTSDAILSAFGKAQGQLNELKSTRFISGAGVTVNADTTRFDIQVIGEIVNTSTFTPTAISVNQTAILATYRATQVESYVWIDNANTVIQSLTPPDPLTLDDIVGYWVLVHSNLSTINVINSFPFYSDGLATKINHILNYLGFSKFKTTNKVSAGTTGTRLTHSGGNVIKSGIGNTTKRPIALLTGSTDATFRMRNQNDVEGSDTQTMDVANIDIAGTTTALANNKFGAGKVWKFSSSFIRVQRGQKEYANFDDAVTGIFIDTYIDSPNGLRNGMHIGWVIFKKNTSWGTGGSGTDGVDYKFIDITPNGSSGSAVQTLQSTYGVSTQPQIKVNPTQGAVQIQSEMALNTDTIFQWKNIAGTVKAYIDGNGDFTAHKVIAPTNLLFKQNTDISHTGTVSETILFSVLIPAGTFEANDTLKYNIMFGNITNNANVKTARCYTNTVNNLTGAPVLIATRTLTSTANGNNLRNLVFKNSLNSQTTLFVTTSAPSDENVSNASLSTLSIDFTVDQYFIVSMQLANSADSASIKNILAQILR